MRMVLTGSPGTGKTTLGKKLAKNLKATFIEVNALVKKDKLLSHRKKGETELTVNLKMLEKALKKKLKGKRKFVVVGHLACEVKIPADLVIVLRCEPRHLWNRLKKRKYSFKKIRDNVLTEILDYCGVIAEKKYRKIIQVEHTAGLSAESLLKKIRQGGDKVSWMKYLKTHEKLFR